jgi:hypothetical protein
VTSLVVLCSLAETTTFNKMFHDSLRTAVLAAGDYAGGQYDPGSDVQARRAFGRIYAPWCLSAAWFREAKWVEAGYPDLEAYLVRRPGLGYSGDCSDDGRTGGGLDE